MQQTKKRGLAIILSLIFVLSTQTLFAQTKTSSNAHEIKNEDLKEYLGQYDPEGSGPHFSITISLDGEAKLMAQPTDKSQPNTLMVATKEDHFDLANTPLKISFNRNEDEEIISLTFRQGSQSFTAKRVKTP